MDTAAAQSPTNAEVARRIGLNHSSVSRMRSGARAASLDVIYRIASEFDVPPGPLLAAAAEFRRGNRQPWTELITRVFDGERFLSSE